MCQSFAMSKACPGCETMVNEAGCPGQVASATKQKLEARFAEGCVKGFNSWLNAKLVEQDRAINARLGVKLRDVTSVPGL
jgi:hypothetical protein